MSPAVETRGRLLAVDDDPGVLGLLGKMLPFLGWEADLAPDAGSALALAPTTPWHGAVLDIDLPDRSGFELLAELRRRPGLESLPAVFITGRVDWVRREMAATFPSTLLLPKPFSSAALAVALNTITAAPRTKSPKP